MRTDEIPSAATTEAVHKTAQGADVVEQSPATDGPPASTYTSLHWLLRKAERLSELPQEAKATIWIRDPHGHLQAHAAGRHSAQDLLQWINMGWVYILWDFRCLEFEEITPEWPKGQRPSTQLPATDE